MVPGLRKALEDIAHVHRRHERACTRNHASLGDFMRDLSAAFYIRSREDELCVERAAVQAAPSQRGLKVRGWRRHRSLAL